MREMERSVSRAKAEEAVEKYPTFWSVAIFATVHPPWWSLGESMKMKMYLALPIPRVNFHRNWHLRTAAGR